MAKIAICFSTTLTANEQTLLNSGKEFGLLKLLPEAAQK